MARLAQTPGLTDVQRSILETVREFVDKEIVPHAQRLEHADEYPADIVAGMREMGLFGLTIAEEYGGLGESLLTYALVVEELSRGWMSISGIVNTHFMVAYMSPSTVRPSRSSACCRGWLTEAFAEPFPCRSRAAGPTCPRSCPGPNATATRSSSMDRRCG